MKRMQSRKSHSWWWKSHISPKNSKWLAENLAEMDRLVKEMLKLIEEEGDSFAKKAEMYYKRRPDLISHVEDFYRMYRALAERYDHVTGELRKTIPSELCTQGSGSGSDLSSEPPSPALLQSPELTPESKTTPPKLSQRAAGFNVFLGSGSSDISKKGSDGSSSSESDSESDGFGEVSVEDFSSALDQRIVELENELCDVKEKLRECEKGVDGKCEHLDDGNATDLNSKVAALEEELRSSNEKLFAKEAEIVSLQQKLKEDNVSSEAADIELCQEKVLVSELRERISELEAEVLDFKRETEDLKAAMTATNKKYESDASSRDEAIAEYKGELERVSERYLQEKSCLESDAASLEGAIQDLKAEIQAMSDDKSRLEARVLEQEHVIQELEAMNASSAGRFFLEKSALEAKVLGLSQSHASLEVKLRALEDDIRQLEAEKAELNQNLEDLNLTYEMLLSEKHELSIKLTVQTDEVKNRDDQISKMGGHLHQLHLEHAKLITEVEEARRAGTELREWVKELENEVERQRIMISDGAEGKREAIRQLCFSLEHYRNGYHQLRQVLRGHKTPMVMAV